MKETFSLLARVTIAAGLVLGIQGCLGGESTASAGPPTTDPAPPTNPGRSSPPSNPPAQPHQPAPTNPAPPPEEPAPPPEEPAPPPPPPPPKEPAPPPEDPAPPPEDPAPPAPPPPPPEEPAPEEPAPPPEDPEEPEPEPAPKPELPPAPGGIVENSMTATARPLLTSTQISAFLPQRGPFTFPAPYGTRGARITNPSDCGGQDCVIPVGYSYWPNMNNHVNDDEILIFLGMNERRGGGGPTLFRYNKKTEQVTNAGPLFPPNSRFSASSGEMWYWSPTYPNILYIRDGARLVRYDVVEKTFETVFDATTHFGTGHYIWQMHTSGDDRVHSATLRRSSDYAELGCFVYIEDKREFRFFERKGSHDECQIDRSGRYLVIKENVTGRYGMDNRFIDLEKGTERLLIDEDGAGGHSDMGYGVMIALDNWSNPNAVRRWDFEHPKLDGTEAYRGNHWQAPAPNHVSFTHARPDVPLDEQYVCGSAASTRVAVHTNEIICFLLKGGSHTRTLVVAPVMTDMGASGGGDSYNKLPKGNLDVTGRYFIWTSNMGGNRIDAFIVRVPAQRLYQ